MRSHKENVHLPGDPGAHPEGNASSLSPGMAEGGHRRKLAIVLTGFPFFLDKNPNHSY